MSSFLQQQLTLKFRPKQLHEIVGQRAVVDIISAMLTKYFSEQLPLPSGVLFCGSRGTGKTTMARILSRILNCSSREGLLSCGVCSSCKQIDAGNDVSVIELDAASSGLIEDIRKIKEIALTAHVGNYRIFVLDEVHGMSSPAFQALLKILEEPPTNTMFIMATTEPHKVPDTIISRVMVFEYRRISEATIAERIASIASMEHINITAAAIKAIAAYVDGGMRDAVMALDQLRYVSDAITVDVFNEYYGVVGTSFYLDAVQALADGRIIEGLAFLSDAYARSSDVGQLVDGFATFFKDLLLVKYGATENFVELSEKFSETQLLSLINITWDIRAKVRYTGLNNRTVVDLMFIQFSRVLGKSLVSARGAADKQIDKAALQAMFT
jgi:DNA polymerase-3 subunit gamma/tau